VTKPKTDWVAKQADLERLAAARLRAREIAERLGVTRNAVIGRARRTGVELLASGLAVILASGGTAEMFPCGHPRTKENIRTGKKLKRGGLHTFCRTCQQAYDHQRHQKKMAKAEQYGRPSCTPAPKQLTLPTQGECPQCNSNRTGSKAG
jgi:hypothetical protein